MTETSRPKSLILVFTYGMSLEVWEEQGIMGRETRYYKALLDRGLSSVGLMTYGTMDTRYNGSLTPLVVLPKPVYCNDFIYSLIAPLIHWSQFRLAHIIKSNQSRGAWTGLVAKLLSPRKLFIVRCGWVLNDEIMRRHKRYGRLRAFRTWLAGWLSYRFSDAIFVTTATDKEYIQSAYGIQQEKVKIVPNAVDTDVFTPPAVMRNWGAGVKLICVGRLVSMKNFQSLIVAAKALQRCVEIILIGDGEFKQQLQNLSTRESVPVTFLSFTQNDDVARRMQAAHIFVIPQLYGSGMSKVMLEAMSCGLITIASDIQAHRDVLTDGVNGFLCDADPISLRTCLERVLSMSADALAKISKCARQDIMEKYSMKSIAQQELEILASMSR